MYTFPPSRVNCLLKFVNEFYFHIYFDKYAPWKVCVLNRLDVAIFYCENIFHRASKCCNKELSDKISNEIGILA